MVKWILSMKTGFACETGSLYEKLVVCLKMCSTQETSTVREIAFNALKLFL